MRHYVWLDAQGYALSGAWRYQGGTNAWPRKASRRPRCDTRACTREPLAERCRRRDEDLAE